MINDDDDYMLMDIPEEDETLNNREEEGLSSPVTVAAILRRTQTFSPKTVATQPSFYTSTLTLFDSKAITQQHFKREDYSADQSRPNKRKF